tara:strand:- start:834 stop:1211 length:378 start_codon:yes stop_codon:yes gene_type:complete
VEKLLEPKIFIKKGVPMDAFVLLGCNGFVDDNRFTYCNSIVNPIVDLSKVPQGSRKKLETFLDNACGLFDSACYDYNKCINIVNFLYRQFGIIDEDMLHRIQGFLKMHKKCGIYIMIMLKEDFYG